MQVLDTNAIAAVSGAGRIDLGISMIGIASEAIAAAWAFREIFGGQANALLTHFAKKADGRYTQLYLEDGKVYSQNFRLRDGGTFFDAIPVGAAEEVSFEGF